jgi:hypothetical protein
MADVVAAGIAALANDYPEWRSLRPVIRGVLRTAPPPYVTPPPDGRVAAAAFGALPAQPGVQLSSGRRRDRRSAG